MWFWVRLEMQLRTYEWHFWIFKSVERTTKNGKSISLQLLYLIPSYTIVIGRHILFLLP